MHCDNQNPVLPSPQSKVTHQYRSIKNNKVDNKKMIVEYNYNFN